MLALSMQSAAQKGDPSINALIGRSLQHCGLNLAPANPISTHWACFFFAFGRSLPLASPDSAFHQSRCGPASGFFLFCFFVFFCALWRSLALSVRAAAEITPTSSRTSFLRGDPKTRRVLVSQLIGGVSPQER